MYTPPIGNRETSQTNTTRGSRGLDISKMISRRENLLVRPWQERRYIYHRKKVLSALPAIDVSPPPFRQHVACKMKKLQKEAERCAQIVEDNFTLLQHLSNIMNTTRVDNTWEQPQPNFLHKVGIYPPRRTKDFLPEIANDVEEPKTRKERCLGCNPNLISKEQIIPEPRVPWEPPKGRLSRRSSTPETPATQLVSRCDVDLPQFRGKVWPKLPAEPPPVLRKKKGLKKGKKHLDYTQLSESQTMVLSKGGLSVTVSFPQSTEILLQGTNKEKIIQREFCECKSFPRVLRKYNANKSN